MCLGNVPGEDGDLLRRLRRQKMLGFPRDCRRKMRWGLPLLRKPVTASAL